MIKQADRVTYHLSVSAATLIHSKATFIQNKVLTYAMKYRRLRLEIAFYVSHFFFF